MKKLDYINKNRVRGITVEELLKGVFIIKKIVYYILELLVNY